MKKFLISSLIAAGFASLTDSEVSSSMQSKDSSVDSKNSIQELVKRDLPYTLAAHSSHASHSAHASHASHASHSTHASHSSHASHASYQQQNYIPQNDEIKSRNINSTPPSSILPRSPAIIDGLESDKESVKGNSLKFQELTKRVQLALYGMGYYSGVISGQFNDELKTSLVKYQKNNNLKTTGTLSDNLILNLLGVNSEIK
jgi:hypothetical protein